MVAARRPDREPPPEKGTAQILLYRLSEIARYYIDGAPLSLSAPSEPLTMREGLRIKGGASRNYKFMGRSGAWHYFRITGHAREDEFRKQVLNLYASQEKEGLMWTEQGCSAPHDGMHLAAALVDRLGAIAAKDQAVLAATGRWLSGFFAMCELCSDSTGHACFPGFRILDEPTSSVRDIVYRAGAGIPQGKLPRTLQRDRFYTAARAALHLAGIPGGLPERPWKMLKFFCPMTVERHGRDSYTAFITKPPGVKIQTDPGNVDWIEVKAGEPIAVGRDWKEKRPDRAHRDA